MHTITVMEQQIAENAPGPRRRRARGWLGPFLQRARTGVDLVILECIAVALFTLLACTLLFSLLPVR